MHFGRGEEKLGAAVKFARLADGSPLSRGDILGDGVESVRSRADF